MFLQLQIKQKVTNLTQENYFSIAKDQPNLKRSYDFIYKGGNIECKLGFNLIWELSFSFLLKSFILIVSIIVWWLMEHKREVWKKWMKVLGRWLSVFIERKVFQSKNLTSFVPSHSLSGRSSMLFFFNVSSLGSWIEVFILFLGFGKGTSFFRFICTDTDVAVFLKGDKAPVKSVCFGQLIQEKMNSASLYFSWRRTESFSLE